MYDLWTSRPGRRDVLPHPHSPVSGTRNHLFFFDYFPGGCLALPKRTHLIASVLSQRLGKTSVAAV